MSWYVDGKVIKIQSHIQWWLIFHGIFWNQGHCGFCKHLKPSILMFVCFAYHQKHGRVETMLRVVLKSCFLQSAWNYLSVWHSFQKSARCLYASAGEPEVRLRWRLCWCQNAINRILKVLDVFNFAFKHTWLGFSHSDSLQSFFFIYRHAKWPFFLRKFTFSFLFWTWWNLKVDQLLLLVFPKLNESCGLMK